jgi:exopolysaccharide biosynthesis polyprenyl glycosylphosphotransferase
VVLLTGSSRVLLARRLRRVARRALPAEPAVARVGDWLPVTVLTDRPIQRWSAVFKSGSDFVLASLILLLLLPLLGAIALAIRLDSPGPILFTQRRHGLNNSEFDIYKFRTMRAAPAAAAAALQQTVRGDSRITRVGRFLRKWSLDELPQVFNVLQGTMALVGPRPHAVNMRTEQRLGHEITDTYPHRHRVKPGITGWSQINGARGATHTVAQLQRRVELDLFYVDHWSPLLDLKILTLTFREVLRATNAY